MAAISTTSTPPRATRSSRLASRQSASRPGHPHAMPDVRPSRLVLTDDDLRRHVLSRLSQFGPQVARAVTARVRQGDVTLLGDVGSDYERQLVEHSIVRLAGVGSLENRLQIRGSESETAPSAGLAMTPVLATRHAALVAGATGALALGWGLWQLAAACTG